MSRSSGTAGSVGPAETGVFPGATVPELTVELDTVHLFMFSAITWNRHLIHYDQDQARREGHDAVVAQRSLLGNYFARQMTTWLRGEGRLTGLSWKVVRGSVPGDVLTCRGSVTGIEDQQVTVVQELVNQRGEAVATATATAQLGGIDGDHATGPDGEA